MRQAVAHHVVRHASKRVVGVVTRGRGIRNAKPAQCTLPSVQIVAVRHRCLSNHVTAGLSIVTIVIKRKVLAAGATTARTGNPHESHSRESGSFFLAHSRLLLYSVSDFASMRWMVERTRLVLRSVSSCP